MNTDSTTTRPIAIVTGAARGIGLAITRRLLGDGWAVMLSDIQPETLEQTRNTLANEGFQVGACVGNVAKADDAERLINTCVETFNGLDAVVNNAGITRDGLLVRMTEEAWDAVININLKGTFLVSRAAVKYLMKKRSGVIINIASVIGLMGNSGQANYAASKAGVIAFTKSLAKEFGRRGIRANAIAPGFIRSDMTDALTDATKQSMLAQIPLNRFGTPEDVAELVAFLASPKAAYINGQVVVIDGGMVM